MLRATSEMAVASRVWSVVVSSSPAASSRARWRAVTTSMSDSIAMRSSTSGATVARPLLSHEQGQALLEVERGEDVLEVHAELHHGEGDLGLDADDHGLRAAQSR